MSIKQWESGDIITANDLNRIETETQKPFILKMTQGDLTSNISDIEKAIKENRIIIFQGFDDFYNNYSFEFPLCLYIEKDSLFSNIRLYLNGNQIYGSNNSAVFE